MVKTSQILKELQTKIAALEARVQKLEHPQPKPEPVTAAPPAAKPEISEETMLLIAAAVAAYLGERAHIRIVRLAPSHAWAQQGRVSIQASHYLV